MSLKFNFFRPFFECPRCAELNLKISELEQQAVELGRQNQELQKQLNAIQAANAAMTPLQPVVPIAAMSPESGWAHLKASVVGHKKASLQDAHRLLTEGENAFLVVCDGAGSKKHSKAGADFIAGFLADRFRDLMAQDGGVSADNWPELSRSLFHEATKGLKDKAKAEVKSYDDYGCTCIVVYAGKDFVACAHVGDGRAGYLDPSGHWKALMTPYKGALANATVFMTMLEVHNADTLMETQVVKVRTRAVVALSDGPEEVCWQVSAFNQTGQQVIDPNQPSNEYLSKIANQLAAKAAKAVSQADLDTQWQKFLTDGSPKLAAQVDDKTLLLALRG
jgi:hypothetical protein